MDQVRGGIAARLALIAAHLFTFTASAALATPDFKTVGGMRDNCRLVMEKWEELDQQEMIQATACSSYVGGMVDVLTTNCRSDFSEAIPEILKVDYGHTGKAYVQAFLNWADENPDRWSDKKYVGLLEAISSGFPCKE